MSNSFFMESVIYVSIRCLLLDHECIPHEQWYPPHVRKGRRIPNYGSLPTDRSYVSHPSMSDVETMTEKSNVDVNCAPMVVTVKAKMRNVRMILFG